MSLITDISTIVSTLYPASTYILSNKFNANLASFNVAATALPLIILDNELMRNNEIKANNNVVKTHRIIISVFKLDNTNNTDTQSNTIFEQCEVIADHIAANIYLKLPVIPNPRQQYTVTPAFHAYNANLTGAILSMQVGYNSITDFTDTLPIPTP